MNTRATLLALGLLAPVAGCAVGPDFERPAMVLPDSFAAGAKDAFRATPAIAEWWKVFGDPTLEDLVARAARANLDLTIAEARVREARALRTGAALELLPIAQANAGYTRGERSDAAFNGLADRDFRQIDVYSTGFDATWEIDIFGRVRRNVEANDEEIEAATDARRDILVSVLAEVARNYLELRGTQERLEVAQGNAENQRKTLELTETRLRAGRGTTFDVARARAQLELTRAALPAFEAAVARTIHRLGVLLGEEPTALAARLSTPAPIPDLPALVAIGSPGELIRRRPDIRVAEHRLHAETARVGVAKADFFPRVTFNGSVAMQASEPRNLGKAGSESWAIGPSIRWAAFDMGRVNAFYQAAGERAGAALARYRQTVLLALENVESSLVTFGRERARREILRSASSAQDDAAKLARDRYRNGVDDFLVVLDAELRLLQTQDRLAEAETSTATALVAVYKALGGGWQEHEDLARK